jgi:hypothetical protein
MTLQTLNNGFLQIDYLLIYSQNWVYSIILSTNRITVQHIFILAAPNVFVGDTPIKKVKETKALGLHIDEFLSWDKHIDKIPKKISFGNGANRKLKSCVDHNTFICAYTSTPRLLLRSLGTPLAPHFLTPLAPHSRNYKIGQLELLLAVKTNTVNLNLL